MTASKGGIRWRDDEGTSYLHRAIKITRKGRMVPTARRADMFADLERQVVAERERQHTIAWSVPTAGKRGGGTGNARHAKRLAGWPSGEWQWMKVGG